MKKTTLLLLLIFVLISGTASADFYKYTDENGVTRFTDDLSIVPKSQRPNVQSYEEAVSRSDTSSTSSPRPSDKRLDKNPQNTIVGETQAIALEKRSRTLDREYQKIIEDRDKLDKQRADAKTVEETKKYNQKIVNLNERIRQWENKRDVLNADLEAYNAQVARNLKKDQAVE